MVVLFWESGGYAHPSPEKLAFSRQKLARDDPDPGETPVRPGLVSHASASAGIWPRKKKKQKSRLRAHKDDWVCRRRVPRPVSSIAGRRERRTTSANPIQVRSRGFAAIFYANATAVVRPDFRRRASFPIWRDGALARGSETHRATGPARNREACPIFDSASDRLIFSTS